jgi:hypothetical protein
MSIYIGSPHELGVPPDLLRSVAYQSPGSNEGAELEPESIDTEVTFSEEPSHPVLPGVPKYDELVVRLRDGDQEYVAILKAEPSKEDSHLPHILLETKDRASSRTAWVLHANEVAAYIKTIQAGENKSKQVWAAVDEGVIIAPVITYEGAKLAMLGLKESK